MIQCKDCEFCEISADGQVSLKCNPFADIKESECLLKWQLLRLDLMTRAYMATIAEYKRIAPMQEKLYRHMTREVDEADEADKWKHADDEDVDNLDDSDEPDDKPGDPPLDDRL